MHARTVLAVGAAGGFLAFAGPALAAPGPLSAGPHQPPALTQPPQVRPTATTKATATSSTLYVNGTTGYDSGMCTKTSPCKTIQYAINLAPPKFTAARIDVAAGNYPEQLTISSKNLTIVGAGKGKTIIDPTSLDTTGFTGAVTFEYGDASSLSGVTVDATAASAMSDCPAGVVFYDESGTLSASAVMVSDQPLPCGDGVAAYNDSQSTVDSFAMTTTTVSDYGTDGVSCGYNSGSCSITDSHITGNGPTGTAAQYGIYAYETPSVTLQGNTVTGNVYTSPQFTGANYGDTSEGIGVEVNDVGRLVASKNLLTGNDMGLYGTDNTGSWTITANTITHATNDTGSAPGSAPVPDGNFVGDGLTLFAVSGAIVDGNTITSNADRGINLLDTSNSTFSTAANGHGNTVSHNGDDGVALTSYSAGGGGYDGTSAGNSFSGNVIAANSGDGIFAAGGDDSNGNPVQENNAFSDNTMQGNLRWDALDQSTGSGSDGTANTWTSNTCNTSSPAGICTSIAS